MATLEEKTIAFECYQKSHLTDQQLSMLRKSVDDLLDTMRAMGESGYHIHGYFLLSDSLRHMENARKMDRKVKVAK